MNAFGIRAASSMFASGGTVIKVKKYINHPKNGEVAFDYDFSLLELAEPIQFNDRMQPIALPEEDLKVPDDAMCEISGWG